MEDQTPLIAAKAGIQAGGYCQLGAGLDAPVYGPDGALAWKRDPSKPRQMLRCGYA